jgi:hypothetical protein
MASNRVQDCKGGSGSVFYVGVRMLGGGQCLGVSRIFMQCRLYSEGRVGSVVHVVGGNGSVVS